MNLSLRELAARCLYNADLNITEDISVKQIVDMMETYGAEVAELYYRQGISDTVMNRVHRDKLFCERPIAPKNPTPGN